MDRDRLLIERMTWPEVKKAIEAGMETVVVACGAIEQHGPHLPLLVDAAHGSRLALEVADRLGDALVAPTIRVGCSEHHLHFAGTVSLAVETFEAVCRDYCTSLARHGFRRVVFLPTHGGNFRPLADMLPRLRAAVPDIAVHAFTDLIALVGVWKRVVQEESGLAGRVGGHADIAETSLMLHLEPGLVRMDRAVKGHIAELTIENARRFIAEGFHNVTPNGILGDARGARADIGRRCIEELADLISGQLAAER